MPVGLFYPRNTDCISIKYGIEVNIDSCQANFILVGTGPIHTALIFIIYVGQFNFVMFFIIDLTMEAATTCETSVNVCQSTRRYSPEDSHFRTHLFKNLKSSLTRHHVSTLYNNCRYS
jgi:hypothetical protein